MPTGPGVAGVSASVCECIGMDLVGLNVLLLIAICLLAPAIFYLASLPDCILEIHSGKLKVRRGRVSRATVRELQSLIDVNGVPRGKIKVVRRGGRVFLRFTKSIPVSMHQRIRNVMALK